MAQFSYSDYVAAEKTQNSSSNSVKVGFFKLANDGDEALVRINCSSVNNLHFATIHQLGAATRWMKVSCLSEIVGAADDKCPLCKAIAAGNTALGKAQTKVFIEMLVSYKDKTTGQWSAPVPAIWERPAGFSRDLANKLNEYGPLTDCLLKVRRNGKANDMKTTYSLDYAVPTVYKPEMIPADFSAFGGNFKISKHSYWEKTAEEIETFLRTGSFPEVAKKEATNESVAQVAQTYAGPTTAYQAPVQPAYQAPVNATVVNTVPVQPVYQAPVTPVTQAAPAQATTTEAPRNFSNFSF